MKKEEIRREIDKDLEKIKEGYGKETKDSKDHRCEGERGDGQEKNGKNDDGKRYKEGGHHMNGLFISKRTLWLAAGGALGAKEWAAGKYEKAKEDLEDIVAEAKHAYYKDLEATAEAVKKEKEILEKVEKKVEETLMRRPKKEE